jgi:hypothetical protein
MLSRKVQEFGLEGYALPPQCFYPLHYIFAAFLFTPDTSEGVLSRHLEKAYAVHFWNELLRRKGFDKNASYPETSIYEQLKARYGIAGSTGG